MTGELTIMVHVEDVSFQTDSEYIPDAELVDTISEQLEPEKPLLDTNVRAAQSLGNVTK